MDLAAHLGMTLERLLNDMSSAEFTYWIAKYKRDPFGSIRSDVNAAMIVQHLDMLIQTKTKARSIKPKELTDFMPFVNVPKKNTEEQTPEELLQSFIMASGSAPEE